MIKMLNENIFFRLSETFDRFEIRSKLADEMLSESSDEVDDTERAYTSNETELRERSQQNITKSGE